MLCYAVLCRAVPYCILAQEGNRGVELGAAVCAVVWLSIVHAGLQVRPASIDPLPSPVLYGHRQSHVPPFSFPTAVAGIIGRGSGGVT